MIFVNRGDDISKHECLTGEEFDAKYPGATTKKNPSIEMRELKRKRLAKRITLRSMAEKLGIGMVELNKIESGSKEPAAGLIREYSECVKQGDLLFDPEDNLRTVTEYSPASFVMSLVVLGGFVATLVMFCIDIC